MHEIVMDTPLAGAITESIQSKVNDLGWAQGSDDNALAEYITLMLVNGKDQAQIAHELSTELLSLEPEDPNAINFAAWLFQQVEQLVSQANGTSVQQAQNAANATAGLGLGPGPGPGPDAAGASPFAASPFARQEPTDHDMDMVMGGAPSPAEIHAPTGPRSMNQPPMRGSGGGGPRGSRDKRMMGHINRAMDRSHDSVLHRVRSGTGNERVNSHGRGPPTGPRTNQGKLPRSNTGRAASIAHGLAHQGMNGMPGAVPAQGGPPGMNSGAAPWMMQPHGAAPPAVQGGQQQMQMVQMLEQQSRLIQQLHNQQQALMNKNQGGGRGNGREGYNNRGNNQNGGGGFRGGRRGGGHQFHQQNHHNQQNQQTQQTPGRNGSQQDHIIKSESAEGEDVDMSRGNEAGASPDETICKYNLQCTNKNCKFAHQSPAAPPGVTIDMNDVCSFGGACKNPKCVGRHPSPATRTAHQSEQDCKFYPNCTNSRCPFRHPPPLCRNGGDCTVANCKFTHLETPCKYRPCTNRFCAFKHEEGQRGTFQDKVWVAEGGAEGGEAGTPGGHVSERKFVDESAVEEMVLPDAGMGEGAALDINT